MKLTHTRTHTYTYTESLVGRQHPPALSNQSAVTHQVREHLVAPADQVTQVQLQVRQSHLELLQAARARQVVERRGDLEEGDSSGCRAAAEQPNWVCVGGTYLVERSHASRAIRGQQVPQSVILPGDMPAISGSG